MLNSQEQIALINRLCPCCGVDPLSTELPLTCDNMDLADLGAGYVMYFKMVMFFGALMILFALLNIIKAIANTRGGHCVSSSTTFSSSTIITISDKRGLVYSAKKYPLCNLDWITVHSIANYGIEIVDDQEKTWVFLYFLLYWFLLSAVKSYIKKTNKVIDILNDTPSDWTLIVKNLPVDEPAELIKNNFERFGNLGKTVSYVKKINLAYRCEEYNKLFAKVNQEKRSLRILQIKETPDALVIMKEKLSKQGKMLPDDKKIKVDKSCFSPIFQDRMQKLTEETMEVV